MKSYARHMLTHLLILLLSVSVALTPQNSALAQSIRAFTQEELDQMLAPIALYPDSLLSQILMASTYPLEVGEAARWSRDHPDLKGDQAVMAVEQKNWDPSVKSLVAFPQILMMMDEKLDWTERLGDAFLGQQAQVMDTAQYLRQKAQTAGNLRSNDQIRVEPQGEAIIVEPANPTVVYVPYYDPAVVYGPWWWPAYPPIYWAPWPGYYFVNRFAWDVGIIVGAEFFFGFIDWPHRHVNVVHVNRMKEHRRPDFRDNERIQGRAPNTWQHNPDHRLGVPYREMILRRQSVPANALPETRRDFRGHNHSLLEERGSAQFKAAVPEARPGMSGAPGSTDMPPTVRHSDTRTSQARPNVPDAISRPPVGRPHVFEGVGQGAEVRDFSRRGHSSSQIMVPGSQGMIPNSPKMIPGPSHAPELRPSDNVSAPRARGSSTERRSSEHMREHDRKKPQAAEK